MCGLAGLLVSDPLRHEPGAIAARMQAKLLHRGPDDRAQFISRRRHCALTHTRLAILDLSSAGRQPMATEDGRYTIALNGEIYNYRELRQELEQAGEIFFSRADTEVVLRLFARDGVAGFNRLRGMFAVSLWDEQSQRLTVARDRFGIKPVYYHVAETTFACASEVRALLAGGLVAKNSTAPAWRIFCNLARCKIRSP